MQFCSTIANDHPFERCDRWQRKVLHFAMPDTSDLLHFCLTVQAGISVLRDEPLHRMKDARFEMAVGRLRDVQFCAPRGEPRDYQVLGEVGDSQLNLPTHNSDTADATPVSRSGRVGG